MSFAYTSEFVIVVKLQFSKLPTIFKKDEERIELTNVKDVNEIIYSRRTQWRCTLHSLSRTVSRAFSHTADARSC